MEVNLLFSPAQNVCCTQHKTKCLSYLLCTGSQLIQEYSPQENNEDLMSLMRTVTPSTFRQPVTRLTSFSVGGLCVICEYHEHNRLACIRVSWAALPFPRQQKWYAWNCTYPQNATISAPFVGTMGQLIFLWSTGTHIDSTGPCWDGKLFYRGPK